MTEDPAELVELLPLLRHGEIYAVERWIASGRPIQATRYRLGPHRHISTPLITTLKHRQHDLALLLLCNGYRTDWEPQPVLTWAILEGAWDAMELLLAWGREAPGGVHPRVILDTYRLDLMERFKGFGVDYTKDRCLAEYLAQASRNRPAYGWAKRHRDDPRVAECLDMALGEAIVEGREKVVHLLLWAGANPHRRVPGLRYGRQIWGQPDEPMQSAVETAVEFERARLLPVLKPDPTKDDFGVLYREACDVATVEYLVRLQPPVDWSPTIAATASRMSYSSWERKRTLQRIVEYGGRLTTLEDESCASLRRAIFRMAGRGEFEQADLRWLLRWLARPRNCEPAIFRKVATPTPRMRQHLSAAGLLPRPRNRRAVGRTT